METNAHPPLSLTPPSLHPKKVSELMKKAGSLVRQSHDRHSAIWIRGSHYPAQYLVRTTRSMTSQCRDPIFFSLTLSKQPQTMLTQGKGRRSVTQKPLNNHYRSRKYHNMQCHSNILHKHCLQFLLGVKMPPRVTNKEYYDMLIGMLWYFLQWSDFARTTG